MTRRRKGMVLDPELPQGLKAQPDDEPVEVLRLLGEGTQGVVYAVRCRGQELALKLYRPEADSPAQRRLIERLIARRAPAAAFLWPLYLVEQEGGAFGYLMELRQARFRACEDFIARRVSSTFEALMTAGLQLADSFARLHAQGLCYSDISFGNIFFDPQRGDVRICDNDNVDTDGAESSGVLGTPRFMAPEIVRGEAQPSADTDRYALAVLLFYLLLGGHPLDGALEASIRCMDLVAMRRLYGEQPLYIFDPVDPRNRPAAGLHDNPIVFQPIYPQALMKLFERSFTAGLHAPRQRVLESEWRRGFLHARDQVQHCPACGRQSFAGPGRRCWSPRCGRELPRPLLLELGPDWRVVMEPDRVLYPHHLDQNHQNVLTGAQAVVTRHPQDPGRLGLRNEGQAPWMLIRPDGTREDVPAGRNVPLQPGNTIQFFGGRSGRVILPEP